MKKGANEWSFFFSSETQCNMVFEQLLESRPALPPPLRNLYATQNQDINIGLCEKALPFSKEQLDYLDKSTQLQSSSILWYEYRAGRITASNIHAVMRTSMEAPAPSLVKKLCSDAVVNLNHVPAIKFGRDHEDQVRSKYAAGGFVTERTEQVSVRESGLHISEEHPYLAASPDGIVDCSCCGPGLLEIKCCYKYRDCTMQSFIQQTDILSDGCVDLKHKYYYQIVQQMLVTGRRYCDLVLWVPAGGHVIRVTHDAVLAESFINTGREFWKRHMAPELVTRKLEASEPVVADSKPIHCHCGKPDSNPMVGCDNDHCPNGWFHWKCVGISKEPRSKEWYCPPCKQALNPRRKRKRVR